MSLLWPPITTPQLGGVIVVTFFEKMIHCRAREKTNFWRPWRQELWKRQRWIGILVNWGCFLQKYELLLGQYSKISNQWNFLEKDTNFCWIFYVMQAIHLCLFHSSWRQGLQIFVFSLAPQRIIFSKKVTTMTPLIGGWLWGVITATFFDKMSCRRARVKIKIGMVTFSHPSVGTQQSQFSKTWGYFWRPTNAM